MEAGFLPSGLGIALATYAIATASPGPATLAIMGTAMSQGRAQGLVLAAGIITGSLIWGVVAATGFAAVMESASVVLGALKLAGGLYLLFLAWKAARAALTPDGAAARSRTVPAMSLRAAYRRGLLLHLTNPKAVLAWAAIIALGVGPATTSGDIMLMLGGCGVLGVVIFAGYALLFSTPAMVRGYARARRGIEAVFAAVFGAAGLRLLADRAG